MAAGAALFAMNATGWTILALLTRPRDEVALGLAQMAAFGAGGALAGLVFFVVEAES